MPQLYTFAVRNCIESSERVGLDVDISSNIRLNVWM